MRARLLPLLACPDCGGDIIGDFEEELEEGEISCAACQKVYAVHMGVPSMLSERTDVKALEVAEQFAEQWKHYNERREEYRQQFLDWISPVEPEFFQGKVVLDGGCGKGRHLLVSSQFEPELVIGVDLGEAAYVAKEANRHNPHVEIVRGDMLNLPFKPGVIDYAYSVGVLHHLPNPQGGFEQLLKTVKPGGHISAWVYGLENNEWIVRFVDPFRTKVSARLPRPILRALSWFLAAVLYAGIHGVYKPLHRLLPSFRLPYQDYLLYVSRFPHRELEVIVYDQLNPQIAFYLPRGEFENWFESLSEVSVQWHNQNSWRGFAQKTE